jgi:hypothetical protein
MQQFTVPQFIDVESKIIGGITTRQFLIFLGASLLIFVSYKIFDFALFVTVSIIIFGVSGTFAFLRINGQPFHLFLLNFIQTTRRPRLRVWNHKVLTFEKKEEIDIKYEDLLPAKELKNEEVAELSLIADTKGRYQGEAGGAKIKLN